jgi:signal peptide peptidase SppA
MKDYGKIITKIGQTPWLITPEGLRNVLSIIETRINNGPLSDDELASVLHDSVNTRSRGVRSRDDSDSLSQVVNGVGILPLQGPIFGKSNLMTMLSGATSLEMLQSEFRSLMSDDSIHSILLDVDSPGGTSDLVKEFADELYQARDEKPIYAIANTLSGSAAYYLMSQATQSYATPSAMVGSIGVYSVHEDQSEADQKAGRKFTFVSAGPYKTEGNPHAPLSEEGRQFRQSVADEIYEEFLGAVSRGRNVELETVRSGFGQGRVLTASKALEENMIDGIMPYEKLVGSIAANRPQHLHVVSRDGTRAAATLVGNVLQIEGTEYSLESKDQEHAEPGTGNPPAPRTFEDGSDQLGDKNRSRADRLPLDPTDPKAPKPNSAPVNHNATVVDGGRDDAMNDEQLKAMIQLLGLPETSTPDQVLAAAQTQFAELTDLRNAVTLSTQEQRLRKDFPDFYEQHVSLVNGQRENNATRFAESVFNIQRMEGDKFIPTKQGLSALAKNTIAEVHMKFSEGTANLEDFEKAVTTIMHGGIVDYQEHGSSNPGADPTDIPSDAFGVRKLFADKISEIMVADSLDSRAAMAEAAKRYPDLAAAYAQAIPVGASS